MMEVCNNNSLTTTALAPVKQLAPWYVAATACSILFIAYYVSREDGVYLWDYHGYWDRYQEIAHLLATADLRGILRQFALIITQDYNVTSIVLLQPIALVFGDNRTAYIAALAVIYLVPAATAASLVSMQLTRPERSASSDGQVVVVFLLALTFPPFWAPTLRGYPDIIGLLPLSLASVLALKTNLTSNGVAWRAITIGITLWSAFLFRRWYAYSIVAFLAASSIYSVLAYKRSEGTLRWRALCFSSNLACMCGALVGLIVLFQSVLVYRILVTSYRDTFAFYQVSALEHVTGLLAYLGGGHLALAIGGTIIGIRNCRTRPVTIFVLLNAIFLFALFTRTQGFGEHHYLPLCYWVFMLEAMCIKWILELVNSTKPIMTVSAIVASFIVFASTFIPHPYAVEKAFWLFVPSQKHYPLKFPNRSQYLGLLDDIERLTATGGKVTALGRDEIMSDELLYALARQRSSDWLVRTAQIDKRDQFRIEPLLARYVVVAEPTEERRVDRFQQVIWAPAERIIKSYGIGSAYRRLPNRYDLGGGVTASIFEKRRPFQQDEVDELLGYFFSLYPNWRGQYRLARLLLLSEWVGLDTVKNVELSAVDNLRVWPGRTQSLSILLPDLPSDAIRVRRVTVSILPPIICAPRGDIEVSVLTDGKAIETGLLESSAGGSLRLPLHGEQVGAVAVGPSQQSGCAYVNVRFTLEVRLP
jgi:hypothetical protein